MIGQRHQEIILSYLAPGAKMLVCGAQDSIQSLVRNLPDRTALTWLEHDSTVFQRIAPSLQQRRSIRCLHRPAAGPLGLAGTVAEEDSLHLNDYVNAVSGELFDVILLDGWARNRWLLRALDQLAPHGVVFLHDSQRAWYDIAKRAAVEYGHCGACPEEPHAQLWWGGASLIPERPSASVTGQTPLVVNFYTVNTGYEEEARRLIASCNAAQVEIYSESIASLGAWELNCGFKARFVEKLWQESRRPVLWLDADAIVHQRPILLEGTTCDFALHKVNRWEFASGTIFFNQTPLAELLLRRWVERCAAAPRTWDQITLDLAWEDIIREHPLETLWLPDNYTKIFDRPSRFARREFVVEHFQASRRLKAQVSGSQDDQRPVRDSETVVARTASRPHRQFLEPYEARICAYSFVAQDRTAGPTEGSLAAYLLRIAQTRLQRQQAAEARALLWNAVALSPNFKSAWATLAGICIENSDWDSAVSVLQRACDVLPAETDLIMALAGLLAELNRLDEAEIELRRGLALRSNDLSLLRLLAEVRLRQGACAQAAELFERVCQQNPADVEALFLQAQAREAEGQVTLATLLYEEVLDQNPRHAAASQRLHEIESRKASHDSRMHTQHTHALTRP